MAGYIDSVINPEEDHPHAVFSQAHFDTPIPYLYQEPHQIKSF